MQWSRFMVSTCIHIMLLRLASVAAKNFHFHLLYRGFRCFAFKLPSKCTKQQVSEWITVFSIYTMLVGINRSCRLNDATTHFGVLNGQFRLLQQRRARNVPSCCGDTHFGTSFDTLINVMKCVVKNYFRFKAAAARFHHYILWNKSNVYHNETSSCFGKRSPTSDGNKWSLELVLSR